MSPKFTSPPPCLQLDPQSSDVVLCFALSLSASPWPIVFAEGMLPIYSAHQSLANEHSLCQALSEKLLPEMSGQGQTDTKHQILKMNS